MAKIKVNNKNKKTAGTGDEYAFISWLSAAWILVILAFMPVYTHQAYADVLKTKYAVCLAADGILVGGFILWALFAKRVGRYISKMKSYADPETGKWFFNWAKETFTLTDIFMLAFLLITVISTLQSSPYMYQAFFGNEGRWHGALIFVLYALTYFIVSRYYRFRSWHITVFLAAFLYICVWAVTDYFMLDIYSFKAGISEQHYDIFVSSIGNIDTFTAIAMIPFAFAGTMFIQSEEKPWKTVFYWICFFVATFSMITSSADNAYLSFAVFFVLVPFIALKTRRGLRRFLLTLASFVTAIELVLYCDAEMAGSVVKPSGMISIFERITQLKYLMIGLWIIVLLFYIYDLIIKKYDLKTPLPRTVSKIWLVFVIAGLAGLLILFVMANMSDSYIPAVLEPAKNYLVFNDEWGTWRGLVWRKLMELYAQMPFIHKVFGTGPETIEIYLYNNCYEEIAMASGLVFDSPHNELLQMFLNIGPLGLISYLGIYITPAVMAAKRALKKCYSFLAAVAIVCLCHLLECTVNIMVPMDIPVLFGLIAIASGLYRKSAKEVDE
ncbi:MAG: O-antigen ligase family protein [Lachnospiraceae bacterium]|nr:O-antigen ligase family protein [Lachnospiraceae bacterium]